MVNPPPPKTNQRRVSVPLVGWLLLVAAVLMIIAGPMPWATVLDVSVAGTAASPGRNTLIVGVLLAICGVLIGMRQGRRWISIAACVLAALVVLIAIVNIADIKSLTDSQSADLLGHSVSIGVGLWLTLVAGLAALILSIIGIVRRRTLRTSGAPCTEPPGPAA